MKIYIVLILIILSILSFAGCSDDKEASSSSTNHNTSEKQRVKNETVITKTSYKDNHFQINFPHGLSNFKVKSDYDVPQQSIVVDSIIAFGLETSDINWPTFDNAAEIFRIQIYTIAEWEKVIALPYKAPQVIKATKDYIYSFIKRNSFPRDVNIKESDVQKVIDSFVLLEGEEVEPPQKVINNTIPQGDG